MCVVGSFSPDSLPRTVASLFLSSHVFIARSRSQFACSCVLSPWGHSPSPLFPKPPFYHVVSTRPPGELLCSPAVPLSSFPLGEILSCLYWFWVCSSFDSKWRWSWRSFKCAALSRSRSKFRGIRSPSFCPSDFVFFFNFIFLSFAPGLLASGVFTISFQMTFDKFLDTRVCEKHTGPLSVLENAH